MRKKIASSKFSFRSQGRTESIDVNYALMPIGRALLALDSEVLPLFTLAD